MLKKTRATDELRKRTRIRPRSSDANQWALGKSAFKIDLYELYFNKASNAFFLFLVIRTFIDKYIIRKDEEMRLHRENRLMPIVMRKFIKYKVWKMRWTSYRKMSQCALFQSYYFNRLNPIIDCADNQEVRPCSSAFYRRICMLHSRIYRRTLLIHEISFKQ